MLLFLLDSLDFSLSLHPVLCPMHSDFYGFHQWALLSFDFGLSSSNGGTNGRSEEQRAGREKSQVLVSQKSFNP
jgi:hypothetical protein